MRRRIKGNKQSGKERKEWRAWRARLGLRGQMSEEAERDTVVAVGMVAPLLCLHYKEGRNGSRSASTGAYSSA